MKVYLLSLKIFFAAAIVISAQKTVLPTDPLEGRIVFEEKGCIKCHSINGFGSDLAPDLSKKHYYGSFLELASVIWNHIPEMNRKYRKLQVRRPNFSKKEMLELIGFIYYLRYLGEPGSVSNGKQLLTDKGCTVCHDADGIGEKRGPIFSQIREFASPLYMVQTMWNHGPTMQKEMKELGIEYPKLSGKDIVDITSYIQQVTVGNSVIRMSPGNPLNGEKVFKEKGCYNCHSDGEQNSSIGADFKNITLQKSVTEIAGSMWNHSPVMIEYMNSESIDWPKFKGKEMADLIAYLYFIGFEDPPGDPKSGELIINSKGCINCHGEESGIAPEFSKLKRFDSPIRMIQLMWNHADNMEDMLVIRNAEWPNFTTKEMQNLYAYLKYVTQ